MRVVLTAGAASGARDRRGRGGGVRAGAGAAETELDVLLEALELILEPTLLILQFLDAAVGLPQFVFQPVDAQVQRAGVAGVAGVDRVGRPAGNIGGGSEDCAVCGGASLWKGLRSNALAFVTPKRPRQAQTALARRRRESGVKTSNPYRWRGGVRRIGARIPIA